MILWREPERIPPRNLLRRRCYQCQGIFTTTQGGQLLHVRCPYCSTINGVPSSSGAGGSAGSSLQGSQNNPLNAAAIAAATSAAGDLSPAALARQEQLLRRLQAREITPLVRAPPDTAPAAMITARARTHAAPPGRCSTRTSAATRARRSY